MRRVLTVLLATAGAACAALPAAASAAGTAARAHARLYLQDAFYVHGAAVTVPARALSVTGIVRPYVAGQSVRIRVLLGSRVVKTDRLRIKPAGHGAYGAFTERLSSPAPGIVRVQAVHPRTAQIRGFTVQRAVAVLNPVAGPGSRGTFVALIQQRLAALHVYVPQTGVFDLQTGLALDAYHRLLGAGTSPALDPGTVADLLAGRGAFQIRYPRDGRHAEGNLGRQLLALIDHGRVQWIYPISSGKPSTPTILGRFRVYSRVPGYLPDGMYFSSFFSGGYAIHGYDPAPDYPASHGCMRLPIIDAQSVYYWLSYGDGVDVYY